MAAAGNAPNQRWLPIESNPDVMTKFIHSLGVSKDWSLFDVLGLDEALLAMLNEPVVAMLLLFPINEKYETLATKLEAEQEKSGQVLPADLYYMKQTISNACGTVALIHAVANNLDRVKVEAGGLKTFLDATKHSTAEERAKKLEDDDEICEVHDKVAKQGQTEAPALDEKVDYHFIVFVEKDKKVFELDGRKKGPICHGEKKDSFLKTAGEAIKKYMNNDPDNKYFSLVALTPTKAGKA